MGRAADSHWRWTCRIEDTEADWQSTKCHSEKTSVQHDGDFLLC